MFFGETARVAVHQDQKRVETGVNELHVGSHTIPHTA